MKPGFIRWLLLAIVPVGATVAWGLWRGGLLFVVIAIRAVWNPPRVT